MYLPACYQPLEFNAGCPTVPLENTCHTHSHNHLTSSSSSSSGGDLSGGENYGDDDGDGDGKDDCDGDDKDGSVFELSIFLYNIASPSKFLLGTRAV